MIAAVLIAALAAAPAAPAGLHTLAWEPNGHIAGAAPQTGLLHGRTAGPDPFFVCRTLDLPASPWQWVHLRIRTDASGHGELFWSGTLDGPEGGLSERKKARFAIRAGEEACDIAIVPFWHGEGRIRQLRLDLPHPCNFAIEEFRIEDWSGGREPVDAAGWFGAAWTGDAIARDWRLLADKRTLVGPPLDMPADALDYLTVETTPSTLDKLRCRFATTAGTGQVNFDYGDTIELDGATLEMAGEPAWSGNVRALAIDVRGLEALRGIRLASKPALKRQVATVYAGPEDGMLRAGRNGRLVVLQRNLGAPLGQRMFSFAPQPGAALIDGPEQAMPALDFGDYGRVSAAFAAAEPGSYFFGTAARDRGHTHVSGAPARVYPARAIEPAAYVPEPQPVPTFVDVATYYFPGWNSPGAWDCIRRTAPQRKPLLGYYDEGNPEVVDWQIKWAVEHGVSVFLVDWYWVQGRQQLTHWFEAYRSARYRDLLRVAIMWANHNPPHTHSMADWEAVTHEWIGRYFNLPAYYRLDGWPAIFLWDPRNLRRDLGGTEAVREALARSQTMAQAAGYPGIRFVALFGHDSPEEAHQLHAEGFYGATSYHEWGSAIDGLDAPWRANFFDVVATAPAAWERRRNQCAPLKYYPLADTGWDARPWHGHDANVIAGRVPGMTGMLSIQARTFAHNSGVPLMVLGPWNEWGEGSYIEPCAEFGFDMLEAVRMAVTTAPQSAWPAPAIPADVARGPYDFPTPPVRDVWSFDAGLDGWAAMMGVSDLRVEAGALRAVTAATDPALRVATGGFDARNYRKVEIALRLEGPLAPGDRAQLFWSIDGQATNEAASASWPLESGGAMHTYTVALSSEPRWRGCITALRFDPCNSAGVQVAIDRIAFLP